MEIKKPTDLYNIRPRALILGVRCKDIVAEMRNRGTAISTSRLSHAINDGRGTEGDDIILRKADEVLRDWERQVSSANRFGDALSHHPLSKV